MVVVVVVDVLVVVVVLLKELVLLGRQTFFVRLFLLFLVRVVRMETPPRYGRMKDTAVLAKSEKEYRVEKIR